MSSRSDQDFDNEAEANQESETKNSGDESKRADFCKKITKFLFSHVGLVIMVILYAVAGAFLFKLLEEHQDVKNCQEGKGEESTNIVTLKSNLLKYIQFNISMTGTESEKDNETIANQKIEDWLLQYRDNVLTIRSSYFYTGQDCTTTRWNFADALLFAVTVMTTIGYGNIAPTTWEGQITCICYATLGIPLFLMCLANISGVLGDMFRFAYARICCRLCDKKKNVKNKPSAEGENDAKTSGKISTIDGEEGSSGGAKVVDDEEDANFKGEDDQEKVTVPLTITMIIITGYIVIGAVLFNNFESWGMIASGYFCYITLATIGFGDYVPGQNQADSYRAPKLILGAIYVLIGMSILAMCFDLMQEEIITKFTWLGKKMGIIDQEDDEENEDSDEPKKDKEKENDNQDNENDDNYKEKNNYGRPNSNYNSQSPAPSYSAYNNRGINAGYRENSAYSRQYKS
jgi:potassium channel subfamily K protein